MLRDGFLLFYCATVGFVASGVAASFYKMVTNEPARFSMLGQGWWAAAVTFLFCAVTGPAIVVNLVMHNRLTDRSALGMIFAGLFVALLWSVCSGILVLQLVIQIREGFA